MVACVQLLGSQSAGKPIFEKCNIGHCFRDQFICQDHQPPPHKSWSTFAIVRLFYQFPIKYLCVFWRKFLTGFLENLDKLLIQIIELLRRCCDIEILNNISGKFWKYFVNFENFWAELYVYLTNIFEKIIEKFVQATEN